MKKWIYWLLALLVLAGGGVGVWRWQRTGTTPDVQYKTAPIERRNIVARISASGTLQATVTVQVGAQVSGRIAKLFADYNSRVKKGQLIAKIDALLFQAAVEQADANYASAKASLVRAKAQQRDAELVFARTKALAEQSIASTAELQTAETNIAVTAAATGVARAVLQQAAATLNQARVNLSFCDIPSPIDGVVISRSVDVGQTVASSFQAPVLYTIAEDLSKMQVHTNVAEGDVGRLEPGMEATFTVDAFPGQRFKGKVAQIRNAPQSVQNVVTYDAVLDVDNSDLRLRPGMTATVTIVWAEKPNASAVANAALRFRPPPEAFPARSAGSSGRTRSAPSGSARSDPNEGRALWLLRGGRPERVLVRTGLTDGTVTEVVSGDVNEGDLTIVDATVAGRPATTATTGGASPRFGRMF